MSSAAQALAETKPEPKPKLAPEPPTKPTAEEAAKEIQDYMLSLIGLDPETGREQTKP